MKTSEASNWQIHQIPEDQQFVVLAYGNAIFNLNRMRMLKRSAVVQMLHFCQSNNPIHFRQLQGASQDSIWTIVGSARMIGFSIVSGSRIQMENCGFRNCCATVLFSRFNHQGVGAGSDYASPRSGMSDSTTF